MATTHVFIVGTNTIRYHLEYLFAGTGSGENIIDFNNTINSNLHFATENSLSGLLADFQRVRIGDLIIFYLQQDYTQGVYEGKFYGVFQVVTNPSFIDNNDGNQFLKTELNKSLIFRTLISPYQVYSDGITEWEALDEISSINSPNQMLWSLIYRKLKGNRGNTMITIYESERLINLLRNKNNQNVLNSQNFTFDFNTQKIIAQSEMRLYTGRQTDFNILPRLIQKYNLNKQFETHLQAYILKNIESIFQNENIEWIGNEVSCGVGMQRIDIMISKINDNIRCLVPIELKSTNSNLGITKQIQRYVDWIQQYYIPNRPSDIQPMIISREILDKTSNLYITLIQEFINFNTNNNILRLRYIEFTISNNSINFNEIQY